ncbi:MAG: hypothetical protein ABEH65_09245, partial [Halobacteriales archaeon]
GGATSHLALKSGTLNVNGVYADHSLVVTTGVHRQAPPFTAEKVTDTGLAVLNTGVDVSADS